MSRGSIVTPNLLLYSGTFESPLGGVFSVFHSSPVLGNSGDGLTGCASIDCNAGLTLREWEDYEQYLALRLREIASSKRKDSPSGCVGLVDPALNQ